MLRLRWKAKNLWQVKISLAAFLEYLTKMISMWTRSKFSLASLTLTKMVQSHSQNFKHLRDFWFNHQRISTRQHFNSLIKTATAAWLFVSAILLFTDWLECVINFIFHPAEFAEVIRKTELYTKVPFKLDGPFTELYFGRERTRAISYAEFSQFLHGEENFENLKVFENCFL